MADDKAQGAKEMTESKDNPGSAEVLFQTVLSEMRDFRRENALQHESIQATITKRMESWNAAQDKRMNGLESRTRGLENWRAYLLGIGAAVAVGASWLVSRFTGT